MKYKSGEYKIILDYLRDIGQWQFEYKIRSMRTPRGKWIGARGDRNVRDLIEAGLLEHSKSGKYRIVRFPRAKESPPLKEIYRSEVIKAREKEKQRII